jgi:hypothetical protein
MGYLLGILGLLGAGVPVIYLVKIVSCGKAAKCSENCRLVWHVDIDLQSNLSAETRAPDREWTK